MKQLTKEQVKILSAYEQHFETAVKSSWSRYPGVVALQEIHTIMQDVTATKIPLNTNCQSCVLKLMQDSGRLYFQAKSDKAVELSGAEAAPVAKVAVNSKRVGAKPKKQK